MLRNDEIIKLYYEGMTVDQLTVRMFASKKGKSKNKQLTRKDIRTRIETAILDDMLREKEQETNIC